MNHLQKCFLEVKMNIVSIADKYINKIFNHEKKKTYL